MAYDIRYFYLREKLRGTDLRRRMQWGSVREGDPYARRPMVMYTTDIYSEFDDLKWAA